MCAEHSSSIIEALSVSKSMVCNTRNCLKEGQDLTNQPRTGWPVKHDANDVRADFMASPTMSRTSYGAEHGTSRMAVSPARKKAGGKSVRLQEKPLLSQR